MSLFSTSGRFFFTSVFCWKYFYKIKSTAHSLFSTEIAKQSPNPITSRDYILSQLHRGWSRRSRTRRNQVGVWCKVKVWKYGGEHKWWTNQEDKERGGGICPYYSGEEYILSSMLTRAEEIDEFYFACILIFERGGWYGLATIKFSRKITR